MSWKILVKLELLFPQIRRHLRQKTTICEIVVGGSRCQWFFYCGLKYFFFNLNYQGLAARNRCYEYYVIRTDDRLWQIHFKIVKYSQAKTILSRKCPPKHRRLKAWRRIKCIWGRPQQLWMSHICSSYTTKPTRAQTSHARSTPATESTFWWNTSETCYRYPIATLMVVYTHRTWLGWWIDWWNFQLTQDKVFL